MSKILGIDLGTTNSAAAVIEGGEPRIVENQEGNRTTPSVVALNKAGERLVGLLARRQSVVNPKNTISSVKRLIGRSFDEETIQRDRKWLSYEVKKSEKGGVEVKMGERWYAPEEVSAMVLQKLKADAEAKLGEKIEEAVITVPAYFNDSERQATKQAGEIAGLKVRRILNEPTAAALAYGLNKEKNEKIVVYDFGGGTFDISVLEVGDDTVEVKATGGDTHLGGDDFDQRILDFLVGEYKKQEGVDLMKDPLALQRLREAAEKAKHELSTTLQAEINLPYITSDASGPKHFGMTLSRAKLEELVQDLVEKSLKLVEETVTAPAPRGAGLKLGEINEIVMVGGQTRMPAIQEGVKKLFGREPHRNINPDEVVAIGAAIEAGILQGDIKDVLLLDVTPLTLSIETLGAVATPMIPKNTTVPTSKSQTFSTAADSQTSVEVHVTQGERPMAHDNKTLARFMLDGIPPAPRGIPQIEVVFDIDANGILSVAAKDKASGKEQSVRIEAATNLNPDEVERLKREAAEHSAEDEHKRARIEAQNHAESAIYLAEKTIRDMGEKLNSDQKIAIEQAVEEAKSAKDGPDEALIKEKTEALMKVLQTAGAELYNKQHDGSTGSVPDGGTDAGSTA